MRPPSTSERPTSRYPSTRNLSRRERQIMDVLFRRGDATVAEVMENMPEPPSYSAVRATLRILEEKGHVIHREEGPRYVYLPAGAPEEARADALKHLVRTFFDGSTEQAVTALLRLSDARLSEAEISRLQERIRAARKKGK
ncbi:MAG TPA: BlaI/MecI/CopY family transcriptional regulator [Gemmatimonadaceae bacterium]|nr:BlaI/MecI/CopY family transcriptional regulator [Gemmatimonadaceae bacterium]